MAAVEAVEGLRDLQKALNAAGPAWTRDLSKAHRKVATTAVKFARTDARSGDRRQQRSASAIRPSATKTQARISVANTAAAPMARATFWGSKRRTGWYGAPKYARGGRRQNPEWVGKAWPAGVRGQGPYVLNDSLASHLPEVVGVYERQVELVVKTLAARKTSTF